MVGEHGAETTRNDLFIRFNFSPHCTTPSVFAYIIHWKPFPTTCVCHAPKLPGTTIHETRNWNTRLNYCPHSPTPSVLAFVTLTNLILPSVCLPCLQACPVHRNQASVSSHSSISEHIPQLPPSPCGLLPNCACATSASFLPRSLSCAPITIT